MDKRIVHTVVALAILGGAIWIAAKVVVGGVGYNYKIVKNNDGSGTVQEQDSTIDDEILTRQNQSLTIDNVNTSQQSEQLGQPGQPGQSKEAPDFKLIDLKGNEVSLSDFKGKPVYLNIWAEWCSPCKAELTEIEKLYQETKNTDLIILTVNLQDSKKVVQEFMGENKYSFTFLLDEKNIVGDSYVVSSIPLSIFIDREGNIASSRVGGMTLENMRKHIEEINSIK